MDTYSFLRELADSWVLLGMFGFFISAVLWAFRPGSSETYDEISQIPLRPDQPERQTSCDKSESSDTCQSMKGARHV